MSERPDTPSASRPEIEALRERLRSGRLGQEDLQLLDRLLGTLLNLIGLWQQKNASLSRLRRMLFGPRSDTRCRVASKQLRAAKSAGQHAAILDATVHGAVGQAAPLPEDKWMRGLGRVEQGVLS
jgi:transposase